MKHDAIVDQGIPIHERVPIPDEMIPADSRVEIDAKIQAGYFTTGNVMSMEELANVKGRGWEDIDVRIHPHNLEGIPKLTVLAALSLSHGYEDCRAGRQHHLMIVRNDRILEVSDTLQRVGAQHRLDARCLSDGQCPAISVEQNIKYLSYRPINIHSPTKSMIFNPGLSTVPASSPEGLPQPLTLSHMMTFMSGPSQRLLRSEASLNPRRLYSVSSVHTQESALTTHSAHPPATTNTKSALLRRSNVYVQHTAPRTQVVPTATCSKTGISPSTTRSTRCARSSRHDRVHVQAPHDCRPRYLGLIGGPAVPWYSARRGCCRE
jgi:hypothetical protein